MTYAEALELAHFGTRMFHPRTMIPLLEAGRPAHPQHHPARGPGTRIDADGNPDRHRPTIATREELALLHVEVRPKLSQPLGVRVLPALEAAQVTVWLSEQCGDAPSIAVVVPPQARPSGRTRRSRPSWRGERERQRGRPLASAAPVTLVTLVAESMGHGSTWPGRFFHALGTVGVNVRAIPRAPAPAASPASWTREDTAMAVRTAHSAFNLPTSR